MLLTIRVELDNAAFADGGVEEISRILEDIGTRLPDPLGKTDGTLSLHDYNGNHVGTAEIE
jgi:hypothetical protein